MDVARQARGRLSAPICPTGGPRHGSPYNVDSGKWYCPHHDHYGRPVSHPEGFQEATRAFFTDEEVYVYVKTEGAQHAS